MSQIINQLLDIIEKDPVPEAWTSSYWKEWDAKRVVRVDKIHNDVIIDGRNFLYIPQKHLLLHRMLYPWGRFFYGRVPNQFPAYSKMLKLVKEIVSQLSVGLTFDVWKYAVVLALLKLHWTKQKTNPEIFALIGDGYGTLGACIRKLFPTSRIYFIDLPKGLLFQLKTLETIGGKNALLSDHKEKISENNFVVPDAIGKISENIDCAINIASMQEMNQQSIATYFKFLRERSSSNSHFYCVNRLRKELPGGEVASFADYPWNAKDQIFVDGTCSYYTHFYSPRTFLNGPRFLGLRIPFINYFDGPMMHRLVHLSV